MNFLQHAIEIALAAAAESGHITQHLTELLVLDDMNVYLEGGESAFDWSGVLLPRIETIQFTISTRCDPPAPRECPCGIFRGDCEYHR